MVIRSSPYRKLTNAAFVVLFLHGVGELAFALSGWATTISSMPAPMAYVFITVAVGLCLIGASGVYVVHTKHVDHIQIWTHLYGVSSIFFLGLNAINIIIGLTHLNDSIQSCQNPLEIIPRLIGSVSLYNYPVLQDNCQGNISILIGVTAGATLISLIVLVIFGRFPQRYISELVHSSRITMLSRSGSFAGPMTMARKMSTRRAVSVSSEETLKDKEEYYGDEESGYHDDTLDKMNNNLAFYLEPMADLTERFDDTKSSYSRTSLLELYKRTDNFPTPPQRQATKLNVISKEQSQQNQFQFRRRESKDLPQIPKLEFTKLVVPSSPTSMYSESSYADTVLDNAELSRSLTDALNYRLGRHQSKLGIEALERKPTSGAFRKNTLKRQITRQMTRPSPQPKQSLRVAPPLDYYRPSGLPKPPALIAGTKSILRKNIESAPAEPVKKKSKRKSKSTRKSGYESFRSKSSLSSSYPSLRARFASPIDLGSLGKRFRHIEV